jgi:hypothetical protein
MSLTIDFHAKLSGHEAKEWIHNCLTAMGHAHDDEEKLIEFISQHKPKDFKAPRKSRADKKSSSERSETEYECQLCDARVWNDALGAQCTRKKKDGEWFCTIHCKEASKNDGKLRNGLITEDRPTHAYGDETQQLLPWHDVELPEKKTKKKSGGKGTRKCSNCGECGHNKKTCPHLETEEIKEKRLQKEEAAAKRAAKKAAKAEAEAAKTVEAVETVESVETETETVESVETETETVESVETETEEQTVEDDGAGVGLPLIGEEASVESVSQQVVAEIIDTVVDTTTTDVTTEEFQAARTELKKAVDTDTTPDPEQDLEEEDLEDGDLEEDESGDGETIMFEGIEYTLDTEENIVYDDELAEIGNWDGETIEFDNATNAKLHRIRKLALKND